MAVRRLRTVAVPLAASVALGLTLYFLNAPGPKDAFTAKGSGVVSVVVFRPDGTRPWDQTPLHRGEAVQLLWTATEPRHLAVIALEHGSRPSVIFPMRSAKSLQVPVSRMTPLGNGLGIDETTADFDIWVFHAADEFELNQLLDALSRAKPPPKAGFFGDVLEFHFDVESERRH